MEQYLFFLTILFPILGACLIPFLPYRRRTDMLIYLEFLCLVTSALVLTLLYLSPQETYTLFRFNSRLSVSFHLDAMGKLFGAMVAFLWPLAVLYSFEYMKHESNEKSFFLFYIVTYGVTLGIAFSENIVTLYFFFEALSLVTLPLVMHTRTREAILASRTYLYYMIGGAAFAFIGMVFVLTYGTTASFLPGGVMDLAKIGNRTNVIYLVYILSFFGFGIKTAVWPFSNWLPKAGVAPTPVTALLHAVAVVNTGAFAVMRITYYSFGADYLRGSFAQYTVMGFVLFTIVYGCSRALKETHLKRRLAWSTVSNLSYILFGVVLMTPLGLTGALCHMLFHSFMKITSFFCAGSVIYKTGKNYIHELDGLGRRMPKIFILFAISAFALMGVPGLAGFVSKWSLAYAAIDSREPLAYIGVGCLLVSALLTAIYMVTILVRAFFPGKDFAYSSLQDITDPNWYMLLPLFVFAAVVIFFGIHPAPVLELLASISGV